MTTFKFKGYEFQHSGHTLSVRRDYPASVHKGYPSPFKPIKDDVETTQQATKNAEDYCQNQTSPSFAMG